MGGTINGNFFSSISIDRNDTTISKIGLSLGKKWVEGQPLPNFENTRFFDNYGRLGIIHQRLLAEDPLQNTSLYFWGFPNLIVHHSSDSSRQSFFDGQIRYIRSEPTTMAIIKNLTSRIQGCMRPFAGFEPTRSIAYGTFS